MSKHQKKRDMLALMDAARKVVQEITKRMDDPVEDVTVERMRHWAKLYVDTQSGLRMIYRYDDEKAEFAHETTCNL